MSLALEGTTTSYVEKGLWWKDGSFAGETSHERRAQLAAEAETAFRARCSAFLAATVDMVRRQCEMCLTEAVEDALQRYSALLQDTFQLSHGSTDDKNLSPTDEDYVTIKVEDNASIVKIADESYESKTNLGDMSGSIQWTAPSDAPLADYELDDEYDSVVTPEAIFGVEMNAEKKEDFVVEGERFSDTGPPNLDDMASTQPLPSLAHSCEQCGRGFSRKSHLIRHRLIHTGERPYDCHLCHRRFSQKVHLTSHLLTHNGTDKAPVDVGEKALLTAHLVSHGEAGDVQSPLVLPPVFPPSQSTVWPSSAMVRLPDFSQSPAHPQLPLPSVSTPSKLASTATPRRHRCHECGKYFTRSSHLNRHRLVHTGERPHACSICRKAFSQKVHLQAHLRRQHQGVSDNGLSAGGGFTSNAVHETGLKGGNEDFVKRSP